MFEPDEPLGPTPSDIKSRNWWNVVRAMQAATARNHGIAVIKVAVLVNSRGEPIQWTEPKLTLLEPMRDPKSVLDLLG